MDFNFLLRKYLLKSKKRVFFIGIFLGASLWYYVCLPKNIFNNPYSTVIEDSNGVLLSAIIAEDGQWRFPPSDTIPVKFNTCIRLFEDEYFYSHPGVNPISIIRALKQNFGAEKIKSGGSTITMQLIRLSRKKARTYMEKFIEIILATRAELSFSKNEILCLYAANAPFGGNVVGLEAASWRYYGRAPHLLSWSESATLAVLPNAPSLIYPGKNQKKLQQKRDRLLRKLLNKKHIDEEQFNLAIEEPLPAKPLKLPQVTPHFLNYAVKKGYKGERLKSTINGLLQQKITKLAQHKHERLTLNQIDNLAVLVIDVQKNSVLSYVGNSSCRKANCGGKVDIIQAKRSSGSTLKPFLYTSMIEGGLLLKDELIEDVPIKISGYAPLNFDKTYDGAVPASEALTRSLNIPAVKLLQKYGVEKFLSNLSKLGFKSIDKKASHYGLSLILGGAECTLWELCNAYYLLSKAAQNGVPIDLKIKKNQKEKVKELNFISPASIYQILNVLTETNRPSGEGAWKIFDSAKPIAWKTGTSFGQRDAWAIGVTPEYVVGVWVGNADGEGRPGLTGVKKAAPILFDVFRLLPETSWFKKPLDQTVELSICEKSGYPASLDCPNTKKTTVHEMAIHHINCPFHQKIQLDSSESYRVNSNCYSVSNMRDISWFSLPPLQEWYFKYRNPNYKILPPFLPNCIEENQSSMDFIYPKENSSILIPKGLDGVKSSTIFHAVHQDKDASIFWFLDDAFLCTTKGTHKAIVNPKKRGLQTIIIVDNYGNRLEQKIKFIE